LPAGADVNQVSAGDKASPLLAATLNGHFDLAKYLLDHGANPNLAEDNGATPLYASSTASGRPSPCIRSRAPTSIRRSAISI
jgi:ankyrin repeat protein